MCLICCVRRKITLFPQYLAQVAYKIIVKYWYKNVSRTTFQQSTIGAVVRAWQAVRVLSFHYGDVIMSAVASLFTSVSIIYSTVCSGADQRKHQSSSSLAFVRGIHRWQVNSPLIRPVTRKMFPFDDVIMLQTKIYIRQNQYPELWVWKCIIPIA